MATTEDHIPARSLFLRRKWPEGYVFPACERCNQSSRLDELLMAASVRIRVRDFRSQEEEDELEHALSNFQRKLPHVFKKLKELTRVETRRNLRERGIHQTSFPGIGELYIVEIPEEVHQATVRYGEKLGKALHYMHTGRIIPSTGALYSYPFTNGVNIPTDVIEKALVVLPGQSITKRDHTLLDGQFAYRYGVVDSGEASAYFTVFGESLSILILAVMDSVAFEKRRAERHEAA